MKRWNAIALFVVLFTAISGIVFAGGIDLPQEISEQETLMIFEKGEAAYKAGDYEQAIGAYESILNGRKESGAVYYNLGNSYFKSGRLGKAVLNYERATWLIPRDSDLNFNKRHVFSVIKKYGEPRTPNFIQNLINGHIRFYTLEEDVAIITALVILLGCVFLASLHFQWLSRIKVISLSLIFVLIVIYVGGLILTLQARDHAAVILMQVSSSFEPRINATAHFKLPEGAKVKIIKRQDGWVKVKRPDGKLGWVEQKYVEEICIRKILVEEG